MNANAFLIKTIAQKDNHIFTIEWADGIAHDYRLSSVQKQCPCAGCNDEITGKKLLDEKSIKEDVRAVRIVNVGRYALRIQFTLGCSNGIYGFDMLRKMVGVHHA